MHIHTANHRAEQDPPRGLANRSFWAHDLPRPLLTCRLLGHRPVVDGTGPLGPGLRAARWVCCDRCGVRPDPQGRLDPERHDVGDRWTGPSDPDFRAALPGSWPARPTWTFGGQLLIGSAHTGFGLQAKIGNAGSEEVLAGHIHLGRAFALYLHTERLGTWWQRRLNPTGYESKMLEMAAHHGHLHWKLWAPRDTSRATPRWRDGSARINPLDIVLGPRRYSYTDVGDPVESTLRMPHGDKHTVTLQLQRRTLARKRGGRTVRTWAVDWEARPGIPIKPHGGRILGSGVAVDGDAVTEGRWVFPALAAIAADLAKDRARHGYEEGAA